MFDIKGAKSGARGCQRKKKNFPLFWCCPCHSYVGPRNGLMVGKRGGERPWKIQTLPKTRPRKRCCLVPEKPMGYHGIPVLHVNVPFHPWLHLKCCKMRCSWCTSADEKNLAHKVLLVRWPPSLNGFVVWVCPGSPGFECLGVSNHISHGRCEVDHGHPWQAVDWDGNPFQRRIDGFEAQPCADDSPTTCTWQHIIWTACNTVAYIIVLHLLCVFVYVCVTAISRYKRT